jgi:hypothetical protein
MRTDEAHNCHRDDATRKLAEGREVDRHEGEHEDYEPTGVEKRA